MARSNIIVDIDRHTGRMVCMHRLHLNAGAAVQQLRLLRLLVLQYSFRGNDGQRSVGPIHAINIHGALEQPEAKKMQRNNCALTSAQICP